MPDKRKIAYFDAHHFYRYRRRRPTTLILVNSIPPAAVHFMRHFIYAVNEKLVLRLEQMFVRPASLWGWLMCNALNAMAIVICFSAISAFIGIRESAWHIVVTVAIIISTFYSANYFSALESRNDRRRFFLFAWVVVTIILNFIHITG